MNISYNWLKKYIAADLSAEAMATILTDIGLEVESFEKIETVRGGLQGVVVGEVLTCEKHPDSDHLHVTTVDVGAPEPLRIVCGAPNCRKGLKVLCATVGAVLYPEGGDEAFKIKRSKIRGVESLGMLCAEDELGIGASHDGIMELPADAPVGMPAKEYLHIEDDYLIGVGLTPNRVDAASHIGVARDLAAYLRAKGDAEARVLWPDVSAFAVDDHALEIGVTVENAEAAPRYTGVTITGCKIGPSPDWMQNALRAAGIHPKNNLVDITNYVLFELGQPLHAFDARKIEGRRIVVKTCAEGTPFVTLDGVERKLSDRDLMICSAERPMCIGGVFGGLESGVGDDTTDIFLESAYFNPVWVRKTAKRHGLNTDSSWRFERGVDPRLQVYALKRAALLFKELAGGRISSDIVEVSAGEPADFVFDFSPARSNALIGKELSEQTYRTILDALDVKILDERDGVWRVAVPPYRVDVQREADLVEEVLRIHTDLSREARRDQALAALAAVELPDPAGVYRKYPHELSGGMLQRAMIAAAVVARPKLLLLDEPTTALDVTIQAQILELLKKLNRESGISMLFISHNLNVVRKLCTRTAVMQRGVLVEEGDIETVFRHPRHPYTQRLIAAIPTRHRKEETP